MRAREPDTEGFVDRDGVKLPFEVFGDGEPTLLLLPTWTIIHARFWKAQVPYLARHFRVVTYDGPGNGGSDRPLDEPYTSTDGWARYNRYYWLDHYQDFLEFFFGHCFTEAHSTKQIKDSVGWGLETSPEVLIAEHAGAEPDDATARGWWAASRCPVLVIHGGDDHVAAPRHGRALAEATGGRLVVPEGAGHIPNARDPVRVNQLIREFVESLPAGGPG
jgi:pimeloyl-ACP methyl ester carboxylesterase